MAVRVSEKKAEMPMAMAKVTANSRNSRPTMPPMKSRGISTAMSDTVSETMVKPIWRGTLERSLEPAGLAFLDVAGDIFDHDDGVVDHEAGGNGQRHQGQVVEAVATQLDYAEVVMSESGTATPGMMVARNVRRNRYITATTRMMVRTESELHVVDRGAHGFSSVGKNGDVDAARHGGAQLGEGC